MVATLPMHLEPKPCLTCGKVMYPGSTKRSHWLARRYCCHPCAGKQSHARQGLPQPERFCLSCGAKIVTKGRVRRWSRLETVKFCSVACRSGRNHGAWKGGTAR